MPANEGAIDLIRQETRNLGFLDCGFVGAGYLAEEQGRFQAWLDKGMHGEMAYMERNRQMRLDPSLLVEGAKTIIVVLQNYHTRKTAVDPDAPLVSKYAWGTDYHFVIKKKLTRLLGFIRQEIAPCKGRAFVDSAPVLERAWARKAGLGWIGRNSNLVSVKHGSFFFIGELIIDIELPFSDVAEVDDHCGNCSRCVNACPTGAIVGDRMVDARRCISYQTIELKGEPDPKLKGCFENRVFGCDICQDVCPWNQRAIPHNEPAFDPPKGLLEMGRLDWFKMDEKRYSELFKGSAVERAGYAKIRSTLNFLKGELLKKSWLHIGSQL